MESDADTNLSQIGSSRKSFTESIRINCERLLSSADDVITDGRNSARSQSSRNTGATDMTSRTYENKRWIQRLKGSVFAICETENENKANKLNRTEECILEGTKSKVEKESQLFERQYSHTINAFRARSARLLRNSKFLETPSKETRSFQRSVSFAAEPKSTKRYLRRRQMSEPTKLSDCHTCVRVQSAIDLYEIEMEKSGTNLKRTGHSVCLFNDRQMETFVQLLETEYCSKMPNVTEILQDSNDDLFLTNLSKQKLSSSSRTSIQQRVKTFCKSQDSFNKSNPIPKAIRQNIEDARRRLATTDKIDFRRQVLSQS
ncbi:hypothetical protein FSP39_020401 [Pinctada imbricata]|uniref:Uncharacterized protein n=1 Tax=Pinctada imbricata TaxID=66713 RepID=A0AA89C7V5_PINIB|nr:hypothetical protein FSP39_020401 [Pinctada imbricata]